MAEAGAKRVTSLRVSQVLTLSMIAGGFITIGRISRHDGSNGDRQHHWRLLPRRPAIPPREQPSRVDDGVLGSGQTVGLTGTGSASVDA
jgi:hypothetical protein